MRLFEAIIEANHRAVAGDPRAGLHPAEFADALPLVALTCIDPRLNPLMPEVLGVPEESFIWLRNAGNIITGPLSSTMRSLALACAVKGGREIVIIGHTDCRVSQTSAMSLLDRFQAAGVSRARLPEDLHAFFGLFASERQNVIQGVHHVRTSPLIGPQIPVHGVLVDIESGRLEWLVNGYLTLGIQAPPAAAEEPSAFRPLGGKSELAPFQAIEIRWPEAKIGEIPPSSPSAPSRPAPPMPIVPPPPVPPATVGEVHWKRPIEVPPPLPLKRRRPDGRVS